MCSLFLPLLFTNYIYPHKKNHCHDSTYTHGKTYIFRCYCHLFFPSKENAILKDRYASPNPIITLKTTSAMLPGRTNTVEITPATNHPEAIVVKKSLKTLRLKSDRLLISFNFFLPHPFLKNFGNCD